MSSKDHAGNHVKSPLHALVDYGCTVQRNSRIGGEKYVVVDVDGIVICEGPTIDAAAQWAVYKIETGEDVPDMEAALQRDKDPTANGVDVMEQLTAETERLGLYPHQEPKRGEVCRYCNNPLLSENAWMSDGCPCNCERGTNHGIVSKETCTCDECSPLFSPLTSGFMECEVSRLVADRDQLAKKVETYYQATGEKMVKLSDHAAKVSELERGCSYFREQMNEARKQLCDLMPKGLLEYKVQVDDLRTKLAEAQAEIERLFNACSTQQNEIQQIIGRALGYPKFADDQVNFPGATGDDVCVGDHVAESLAAEIVSQLAAEREKRERLREAVTRYLSHIGRDWESSWTDFLRKALADDAECASSFRPGTDPT